MIDRRARRIGIMTPDLVAHDAIGNDARGMAETLMKSGYEVFIFTLSGRSATSIKTFKYCDVLWLLDLPDDLLIYHYCTPDPGALDVLKSAECKTALKYHNITPSHFMTPYSAAIARAMRTGRRMLGDVLDRPLSLSIGDSDFNIGEIYHISEGRGKMDVLAPFHRTHMLLAAAEDAATRDYIHRFSFNIMTVGRVVPNKGHDDMIAAFGLLLRDRPDRPHLHIIGSQDSRLASYISGLREQITAYAIEDCVTFHPHVGEPQLASFYRRCDLYWTGSKHEGFCVPAIEAMAFGLPILSTRAGALPQTCDAIADYADDPLAMRQALEKLLTDDHALTSMARNGRNRYDRYFATAVLERQFKSIVSDLLASEADAGDAAQLMYRDVDWFGLPDFGPIWQEISALCPPALLRELHSSDRRLDILRWTIVEGRTLSAIIETYLSQDAFLSFARTIEMPATAGHFSAAQRIAWFVSRKIHAFYNLSFEGSVTAFESWFWRDGIDELNLRHFGHDRIRETRPLLASEHRGLKA